MSVLHIYDRPFDPQQYVGGLVFGVTIRIDDGPETGALRSTLDSRLPPSIFDKPFVKQYRTTSIELSGILAGMSAPDSLAKITDMVLHAPDGCTMTFPQMRTTQQMKFRCESLREPNQYDQYRWGTWSLPSCVYLLDFYAETAADAVWTDSPR